MAEIDIEHMSGAEIIAWGLNENGIDGESAERFIKYYELLIEWNERMNLTAITDADEVLCKHFLDSLIGKKHIPEGAYCIDIGSGAGFPGLPLKIVRPDIKLVMIDSLNKRIKFLEEVIGALGLEGCEAVHMRAEEAGAANAYREKFDIALTRAVAPMGALIEWSAPLLRVGGMGLMYKGGHESTRLEVMEAKGAAKSLYVDTDIEEYNTSWGERTLVMCKKCGKTSARFPRKPGEAKRKPL